MPARYTAFGVRPTVELRVPQLVALLARDDLIVFNRHDDVIRRTSEMLADGYTIILDSCNPQVELPFAYSFLLSHHQIKQIPGHDDRQRDDPNEHRDQLWFEYAAQNDRFGQA